MRADIERFSTGWSQVNLRLRAEEIEPLIGALRRLHKSHFHLTSMRRLLIACLPLTVACADVGVPGEDVQEGVELLGG